MQDGGVGGEIGWPEDTVILQYPSIAALQTAVFNLWSCEMIFVVSPKHNAIAMSRQAASMIGVL